VLAWCGMVERATKERKRPNIVSVHLSPEAKAKLDQVCAKRGMSIKMLLGRLIIWFVELDRTEQSIVLGQVEAADVQTLASMLLRRVSKPAARSPGTGKSAGRRRKRSRR
jgi:hypothetical protein